MAAAVSRGTPKLRSSTPVLLVGDIAATMRWYQANLGFTGEAFPPSPPHEFGILHRDTVEIMLQQLAGHEKADVYDKREGGVWNVYVRMVGVRDFYQTVSKLPDVTMLEPLRHQPYGETEFAVRDPNGYVLVFAERL